MRPVLVAALLTLLLVPAAPAFATDAGEASAFTLEAFLEVPVITEIALSPDGTRVAFLRAERSLEDDRRDVQIWLAELPGGEARRLTFDDASKRALRWRADGALSYVAARDGKPQVWLNPLDGSEPRAVTGLEEGVQSYWWAPAGTRLAALATPPEDEVEDDEPEDAEPADADADDRDDWIVRDRLEDPATYPQLYLVETTEDGPADAEPRRLTGAPLHAHHAAWSPDGATIALTYNERFSSLVDEEQRVALVDVESGELTRISPADRHASLAAFSPDGARLAYFVDRRADLRAYLNLKDLVVRDLASGEERVLTASTGMTLGGSGSTPGTAPIWIDGGRALLVEAAAGTTLDAYRVDAATGAMTAITQLDGNISTLDAAAHRLVYVESALHRPGTLWSHPLRTREAPQPIFSTDDAVAAFDLRAPQKLALPGHEGVTVEGFLFLPPGGGDGPQPTIVEMHGGPYYRYGNAWTTRYPWQVLSHAGFAVFIANPRGGTGYGEDFLRGVYRNFGTDDYLDLMRAVDALVERGIADPERLGFTGYSYGGLMTNTVISRTDRFAAAVSIAGIFNYVSAMGQNNPQLFVDSYRRPWDEDLARMWEHSPASRSAAITTPTLVMHGLDDEPVDPRQSIELFSMLQLNGVPSRLVLYPDEGHGINRPSHMLDYQTRELEWFRHYLMRDEDAAGAEEPLPVEP